MNTRHRRTNRLYNQRGVATLTTAVILLFVLSLMVVYASRSSLSDLLLSNNLYRSKQAAENAQAALDFAYADFLDGGITTASTTYGTASAPIALAGLGRAVTRLCTVESTFTNCTDATDLNSFRMISTGYSDDGTAVHYATLVVTGKPVLGGAPLAPLIMKTAGSSLLSGNLDITNNTDSGYNVWSGTDIGNASGSFITRGVVNGVENQIISEKSGSRYYLGPDVVYNDQQFKNATTDQYFQLAVGKTKAEITSQAQTVVDASNPLDATKTYGDQVIHATGTSFTLGQTLGTPTEPVILVVDGEFNFTGNGSVYGVIIANSVGRFAGTNDPAAPAKIIGSLVVLSGTGLNGNASILLTKSIQDEIDKIVVRGAIGNSWRDWQ